MLAYNPRPVFELLANALKQAIKAKDWAKVEEIYEQVKKLSQE
jgi:hypothetical protein